MSQMNMFTPKLSQQQKDQLYRIATLLTNMGCKWAIITPEGEELGNHKLETVKVKRHTRKLRYEPGAVSKYYRPYIENLKPGECAAVPFHDTITPESIRGGISAHISKYWGKGMGETKINEKSKTVEVYYHGGI